MYYKYTYKLLFHANYSFSITDKFNIRRGSLGSSFKFFLSLFNPKEAFIQLNMSDTLRRKTFFDVKDTKLERICKVILH